MDSQRSPLLSWAYFCQGKSIEELRHSLLYVTLELENTKLALQEEVRKRDDQLLHLKELLNKTTKERDQAQDQCQKLLRELEKLLLQQQQRQQQMMNATAAAAIATTTAQPPLSGVSSIEDEPRRGIDSNNGFTSSDCEESIVSSPAMEIVPPGSMAHTTQASQAIFEVLPEKPLPKKGKLLQAVMKAGPLLQTLLLAGPLPQWRHPPPPLESFEIPPVTIPSPPALPPPMPPILLQESLFNISGCNNIANCGRLSRKRLLSEGSASPTGTKYQRLIN